MQPNVSTATSSCQIEAEQTRRGAALALAVQTQCDGAKCSSRDASHKTTNTYITDMYVLLKRGPIHCSYTYSAETHHHMYRPSHPAATTAPPCSESVVLTAFARAVSAEHSLPVPVPTLDAYLGHPFFSNSISPLF